MFKFKTKQLLALCVAGLALSGLSATNAMAQQKELRIAYQPNPLQEASIDMMVKWGKAHNVKIVKIPNSYGVYVEKMTASLTSGADQYDVIWHNDDWGQLWAYLLEPTDDIPALKHVDKWSNDPVIFNNKDGKMTVVPMGETLGAFFYRTDLVKESELPKTWADLVTLSKKLQSEGKVKYGFVGGMDVNGDWNSTLWTLWNNDCDIMLPKFSRDNKVLAQNGWKTDLNQECAKQVAEFWWDALHKDKIIPPGMPAYGRNEANAVFTSGNAAFTVADTTYWGDFNDPKKSKVAGKVALAKFPMGPSGKVFRNWDEIWGWAIPKAAPAANKKLAKEMLSAMLVDKEGQLALWKKTGAPPPNTDFWPEIAKSDPFMAQLQKIYLDNPNKVHSAYYFPAWPAVHKAYNDAMTKAVTGSRDDIGKALADGAKNIQAAATAK
jgi:ABC-type glycerol-3-phosphate transport system substrate-binding protein